MTARVCAIGLDAAEWTLIEPMLARGELPHLERLRRRSAFAHLHNPDYRTGLAWEQFLTGRGSASSRRWSAVAFDPATYTTTKEGAWLQPPFFAQPPVETIAFDVPYLSRSFPVPGVQVTGWGGHDPGYPPGSQPRDVYAEIESRFGVHPASGNDYEVAWHGHAAIERLGDALVVGAGRRAEILSWLARTHPSWELLVTVLSEPHAANEQLWHGMDGAHPIAPLTGSIARERLLAVYRAVDDAVGRIVEDLDDGVSIVVFSMHGAHVNEGDIAAMVLLPELLHRLHGGAPRLAPPVADEWQASGHPPLVPEADERWGAYVRGLYPDDRKRAIVWPHPRAAYRRLRPRPRVAATRTGAQGLPIPAEDERSPEDIGVPVSSVGWQQPSRYQDQWPAMRCFAVPTFYDGRVRINLAGREARGRVALDEYDDACDEIEQQVRACRDARTGKEVVADVRRIRADDPLAPDGPDADIEIVFDGLSDAWVHPELGLLGPVPFRRTGSHSPRGFLMASGPGIEPVELGTHDAIDVTASILALLHGRVPREARVDGKPLIGER